MWDAVGAVPVSSHRLTVTNVRRNRTCGRANWRAKRCILLVEIPCISLWLRATIGEYPTKRKQVMVEEP